MYTTIHHFKIITNICMKFPLNCIQAPQFANINININHWSWFSSFKGYNLYVQK